MLVMGIRKSVIKNNSHLPAFLGRANLVTNIEYCVRCLAYGESSLRGGCFFYSCFVTVPGLVVGSKHPEFYAGLAVRFCMSGFVV